MMNDWMMGRANEDGGGSQDNEQKAETRRQIVKETDERKRGSWKEKKKLIN